MGRQGNDQRIGLTRGCMETVGQVQHEIMHALGLYHEVSRKDRDQYIYINWSNIREGTPCSFEDTARTPASGGIQIQQQFSV